MSSAQPSASAPSAAAAASCLRVTFKKRPRHFWEGPDPADESDEQKQGAEHVSPVARLYRHALESVFGFLELDDLSLVLAVCQSWSAAVRSMKSIGASVSHRLPSLVAASGLASHVGHFGSDVLTSSDSFILSRHLSRLTALSCALEMDSPTPLFFGASLTSVDLSLRGDEKAVPTINDAIVTISRLPVLTKLKLWLGLSEFFPALSFAPLVHAAQLREFELGGVGEEVQPTYHHLDQLRMLTHLRKMAIAFLDDLEYLLRTPHALEWQEIHPLYTPNEDEAEAVCCLPSLTRLYAEDCFSVVFLPLLTRLRSLDLHTCMPPHDPIADEIAAGLANCTQLTDLKLFAPVTSTHMRQALAPLPSLHKLKLVRCAALDSLSFLSELPLLAQSLQSLELGYCRNTALHSSELKHVLVLKSLTSLKLEHSLVEPLDAFAQHLFTPPTAALPALANFAYSN